jgi:hypothetical protein
MKIMPEHKPHTIEIVGRRWFQKTYGNTYHTVEVYLNGQFAYKSGRTYGYGDQYVQTAFAWLESAEIVSLERYSNGATQPPWQWAQDHGVHLTYRAIDVPRQKDL